MLACLSVVLIVAAACVPVPTPAPTTATPQGSSPNAITNIVWQWTSVANKSTGAKTTVTDPQNYTITFRDDGTLSGKADCNTFTGTYTQEGGFFITAKPDVMAACGGASLDQQYFELLDAIVAGGSDGAGSLALETAGGEQRMEFVNGGRGACAVVTDARRVDGNPSSLNQRSQTMLDLPLEYALIGFEGNKFSGQIVPQLQDLAQRGIVRFVDFVFIQKDGDGNTRAFELNDLDTELYEAFVPMGEHVSSLFTTDDLAIAASKLPVNSAAVLFCGRTCGSPISARPSWMPAANWWSAPRSRPK